MVNGELVSGVVFKLDTYGQETVLHSFAGGTDGAQPNEVIRDAAGKFTAPRIRAAAHLVGAEVIFKINTSGEEQVVYRFAGAPDGANPAASVIADANGNLFGTTGNGGSASLGTVYKFDHSGSESVLFNFPGTCGGGRYPVVR